MNEHEQFLARYPVELREMMDRFEQQIVEREALRLWTTIRWRETVDAALAEARDQDQPLFMSLVVGKAGQPQAAEC